MEDSGVEGNRIRQWFRIGKRQKKDSIKRNWGKGDSVWQSGREDKWGEYYKLRSEIKELVRKKKIDGWNEVIENEVIEKANKIFHENRKEFWAFVGKTSKG